MARHIYVIAQARSRHYIQGLGDGWYDGALTERGPRQATAVAARIVARADEVGVADVQSPDLRRAAQTADPVAARLRSPDCLCGE